MTALLLFLLLSQDVQRDVHGKILRHHKPVHEFMVKFPCPAGEDKGSTTRCRGYVVDHRISLCMGGEDSIENMAWQTKEAAKEKDYLEVWVCRNMVRKTECRTEKSTEAPR